MKVENATDLWIKTAQYTNPVLLHVHIIRPCCFRNGTSILQSEAMRQIAHHDWTIPNPTNNNHEKAGKNRWAKMQSTTKLSPFATTYAMYNSYTSDTQFLVLAAAIRLILSLPRLSDYLRRSMDGVCTVRIPSMHLPRWHGHPPKWVGQIARGRIKTKLEQTPWSPLLQSSPSAIAEEAWTGYNVASPRFLCDGTGILQSGTGKLHRDWRQYVICKRGRLTGRKLTTTRCRYYVGQEVKLTRCSKTCRTILSIPRMTITQRKLEKRWKKYSTIRKHKCIICNASIQNSKKLSALMRNRESLFLQHRSTK